MISKAGFIVIYARPDGFPFVLMLILAMNTPSFYSLEHCYVIYHRYLLYFYANQ